jgi:hypothetical protein
LVVNQSGTNAQFKGTGSLNGVAGYKFMIWAKDDSPDTFRIRITSALMSWSTTTTRMVSSARHSAVAAS